MSTVHRVTDKSDVVRRYRLIPYDELAGILKEGETAFLEDSPKQKLNRQTVWKATRKLGVMIKRPVVARRGFLKVENRNLEGYLFFVEVKGFPKLKGKPS